MPPKTDKGRQKLDSFMKNWTFPEVPTLSNKVIVINYDKYI